MPTPTRDQLERACALFRQHEPRDAMYKTATFLVDHYWGRPADMADGLGVLLLTWNQAFYRYGTFDFGELERCIARNISSLKHCRQESILDYAAHDDERIRELFADFLGALAIAEGRKKGERSPVAVAKALHLLAPGFFPLWDRKIAQAYGCDYSQQPAERCLTFLKRAQKMARELQGVNAPPGKTLLKLIDEYNYATITKRWV